MATDITINSELPVINEYVAIPGGEILVPTAITPAQALSNISGCVLRRMGRGIGNEFVASTFTVQKYTRTNRMQDQLFVVLPAYASDARPSADWYANLRTLAGL